jgi:hypothetical protein
LSNLKEPKPGDTVEIVSSISVQAPLGSLWKVNAVFDGVLARGRYLVLEGFNMTPSTDRVKVVKSGEPRND